MRTKQHILAVVGLSLSVMAAMGVAVLADDPSGAVGQIPSVAPTWAQIRSVPMRGDLKAFWIRWRRR